MLIGIVAAVVAVGLGYMTFEKVGKAPMGRRRDAVRLRCPTFDAVMILTMTLVMIVVMIESTGMFLALSEITAASRSRPGLAAGLRTDGLGTLIGGIFNTFPYTASRRMSGWSA